MAALDGSLSKSEYKAWIKATRCLEHLKNGLLPFIEKESKALHAIVLNEALQARISKDGIDNHEHDSALRCNVCFTEGIYWESKGKDKGWKIKSIDANQYDKVVHYCPNRVCHNFINAIQAQHVSPEPKGMCWNNCRMADWSTSHWEVSKAFIDKQDDALNKKSPCNFDCSSLLKFIENAKICIGKLDVKLASKIREHRNKLFHSAQMEVPDEALKEITTDMINLLKSLCDYESFQEAKRAVVNIEETRDMDMEIVPNDELQALKSKEKELQQKTKEHDKDKDDWRKQLQAVQDKLEILQSPIRMHERKSEELKKLLIRMYSGNFFQIPVSPVSEKQTVHLQELYTDILIKRDEKETCSLRNRHGRRKSITVKSYRDLFCDSQVYLLGEAGAGKTTFIKKLIADWVSIQEGKSDMVQKEDVEALTRFQYLFYVPFRASNQNSIFDAVCNGLKRYSDFQATVQFLFENHSQDIIVLCDGLDEVEDIPDTTNLHDATILITMRPWKYDIIETKVDAGTVLKIEGLIPGGNETLSHKVLEIAYSDTSEVMKQEMKKALNTEALEDISKIPMMHIYLLHIWMEDDRSEEYSPMRLTDIMKRVVKLILQHGDKRMNHISESKVLRKVWKRSSSGNTTLTKRKPFKDFAGLLYCLGRFAVHSLLSKEKEKSLVFTEDDIEEYFEPENNGAKDDLDIEASVQLQACIVLGLLNKTDYPSHSEVRFTLCFQHKLIQEFLAAFSIVENEECFQEFTKYCRSVKTLLEMSNVLRFVCGLCPEKGQTLSKELLQVYGHDPDIKEFRGSYISTNICERLTCLFCDCIQDARSQSDDCRFYLADVASLHAGRYESKDILDAIVFLIRSNISTLVSLHVDQDILQYIDEISLLKMKNMLKFSIANTGDKMGKVNAVLKGAEKLERLSIEIGCTGDAEGLYLPPFETLRHLKLHRVTSVDVAQQLQAILSMGNLESLHIAGMEFTDSTLDFSALSNLTSLDLQELELESSVWNSAVSAIPSFKLLTSLNVYDVAVIDDLNFSLSEPGVLANSSSHLQYVNISHSLDYKMNDSEIFDESHSSPTTNYIFSVISLLESTTRLTNVTIRYLDKTCAEHFLTVLQSLVNLQVLQLSYIDFGQKEMHLGKNVRLKSIQLQNILFKSGSVDLANNIMLEDLYIGETIFYREKVYHERYHEKRTEASGGIDNLNGQLVLPSDDGMQMKEIVLMDLTLSGDTWTCLFKSVLKMNRLRCLRFECINAESKHVLIPVHMKEEVHNLKSDSTIETLVLSRK